MKIKSILLSVLLATLSACTSTATNSSEPLHLIDGSNLVIDNDIAVKIIDKTGAAINIEKSRMYELANGNYIYIRRDGTVNRIGESNSSHRKNSKSSNSGHSH